MTDETAALLDEYVQQGGKLIFGCRTGYKDERGQCYMRPFPGAAKDLCGITVEEFTMVKGSRQPTTISWSGVTEVVTGADDFNDILKIEEASVEVMAVYASDYYAGKPAVTRNRRGKGEVWYYGAVFNEQAAAEIINLIDLQSPADWLELPEEVELQVRTGASSSYAFLLNYSETPVTIHLHETKTDLLSGTTLSGEVLLEGFGVLVLN